MNATINFEQTSLASCYSGFYAKVLDNVFSPLECAELIQLASSQPEGWKPAGLSTREGAQTVHSGFRNSERTLVINEDVSKRIYERLRPLVDEIDIIASGGKWAGITGKPGRKQGSTWAINSVNPRLSFLRYGPGHYFKPHCDGLNDLEDGALKSFVTLHVYLTDDTTTSEDESFFTASDGTGYQDNGQQDTVYDANDADNLRWVSRSPDARGSLAGGATRFWSPNKKDYLDVEPKIGRVLVFQQRMLVHSGEEVTRGMKYTMRGDFMFREMK